MAESFASTCLQRQLPNRLGMYRPNFAHDCGICNAYFRPIIRTVDVTCLQPDGAVIVAVVKIGRWNLNIFCTYFFTSHKFQVNINNSHKFMLYYCKPFNSACILQVFDDLFTSASLFIHVVISFRDSLHFKTSNFTEHRQDSSYNSFLDGKVHIKCSDAMHN